MPVGKNVLGVRAVQQAPHLHQVLIPACVCGAGHCQLHTQANPTAPQVYAPGLHDRPHSSHLVKYFFPAFLHGGLCKEVRPELRRGLR